jgi:hypothetical protein
MSYHPHCAAKVHTKLLPTNKKSHFNKSLTHILRKHHSKATPSMQHTAKKNSKLAPPAIVK